MSSIDRISLGSEMRFGLLGEYGVLDEDWVDWVEFRDSQCIVFDMDGRRSLGVELEEIVGKGEMVD